MDRPCVVCTTCQARLRVKKLASIGQIVACPRCGSMVMVSVPPDSPGMEALRRDAVIDEVTETQESTTQSLSVGDFVTTVPNSPAIATEFNDAAPVQRSSWMSGSISSIPLYVRIGVATLVMTTAASTAAYFMIFQTGTTRSVATTPPLSTVLPDSVPTDGLTDTPLESAAQQDISSGLGVTDTVASEVVDPVPRVESVADAPLEVAARPPEVQQTPDAPKPSDGPPVLAPELPATQIDRTSSTDPIGESAAAKPSDGNTLGRYADLLSGTPEANRTTDAATPDSGDRAPHKPVSVVSVADRRLAEEKLLRQKILRYLQLEIQSFDSTDRSLMQVLQSFARLANAGIQIEPDSLLITPVELQKPVSHVTQNTTLESLLREVLAAKKLTFEVQPGYVRVYAMGGNEQGIQRKEYSVSDLSPAGEGDVKWIHEQIRRFVHPNSWVARNDSARSVVKGDILVIDQTPEIHGQIIRFLDRMRLARGIPRQGGDSTEGITLENSRVQAEATWLQQPIELAVRQPTQISELLFRLAQKAEVGILIDWQNLARNTAFAEMSSVYAPGTPLSEVLRGLLPQGIDYRVIDGRMIQITSADEVRLRGETTVFALPESMRQVPASQIEQQALRLIAETMVPDSDQAIVTVDPKFPVLFVRVPQPIHRVVADWLASVPADDSNLSPPEN
ncbi:MAG: hypothetical protein O2931_11745 [Planctomycetota bacterium]|nr:hypothetical protein [Planctomycetota bacterium]MDA1179459.1 hypothetical protein [Planctomycetota bacterium]